MLLSPISQSGNDEASTIGIATIFAHVSCGDIDISAPWYEALFGKRPIRRSAHGLVEWQFSESAEVRLCEEKEHAGHSRLTLGVLPMEPKRRRLIAAGLEPGQIEETEGISPCPCAIPTGI